MPEHKAQPIPYEEGITLWQRAKRAKEDLRGNLDPAHTGREFLKKVIQMNGVYVDREKFLRTELGKAGVSDVQIALSIMERPAAAGIPPEVIEQIVDRVVEAETRKCAALSFAAGLPGGAAAVVAGSADLAQYFVHALRLIQQMSYLYGWQSLMTKNEQHDDAVVSMFAIQLALMLGASRAGVILSELANKSLQLGHASIDATPMSRLVLTVPTLGFMRVIGQVVLTNGVTRTVVKAVPLAGGAVSGALTYGSLKLQATRLRNQLSALPQAHR